MIRILTLTCLFVFLSFNNLKAQDLDFSVENKWDMLHNCLDCHNEDTYETLIRLATGKLLEFEEANTIRLCGQCHGNRLRDWNIGDHGKRIGYWNGQKEYVQCTACHDPHATKFKKIQPMPPPIMQEDIFTEFKKLK